MGSALAALFDFFGLDLVGAKRQRKTAKVVTERDIARRRARRPITATLLAVYRKRRALELRLARLNATAGRLLKRGIPRDEIARRLRLKLT